MSVDKVFIKRHKITHDIANNAKSRKFTKKLLTVEKVEVILSTVEKVHNTKPDPGDIARAKSFYECRKLIITRAVNFCN